MPKYRKYLSSISKEPGHKTFHLGTSNTRPMHGISALLALQWFPRITSNTLTNQLHHCRMLQPHELASLWSYRTYQIFR